MNFHEDLPNQCPPETAKDTEYTSAWRFVPDENITMEYFLSYSAIGETRLGVDTCMLASCSLFTEIDCKGIISAKRLPKLRNQRLAEISIPVGSGLSLTNKNGHIHFWMYDNFNPVTAIKQVITNDAA